MNSLKKPVFTALIFFLFLQPEPAFSDSSVGNAIFDACWEEAGNHVGAAQCLHAHLKLHEEKLKKLHLEALQKAEADDQEFQPLHNYEIEFHEHQKASNYAFDSYMESECAKVRHSYMAGNGAEDGYAVCKINLINERLGGLK